jgi:metallo-beta-lactamase family protein
MTNSKQDRVNKDGKLTLTFCGGVGSVTGANFLLTGPDGMSILVDCGLEQGTHDSDTHNHQDFIYNPKDCNFLLVTHAHLDHIGKIPKLVREGFRGTIYSTPETLELTKVMLDDALKITTQDSAKKHVPPLYEEKDVIESFKNWKTIEYHKDFELAPNYSLYIKDSGHILGSAMFELTYKGEVNGKDYTRKIVFTGDLGNSPTPLLHDTEKITDADYLVMESVYGDKNHEDTGVRLEKLKKALLDNYHRNGTLIIPSFSLEKTQEVLFEIHKLMESKELPEMRIYLDSPLALRVTEIYRRMKKDFNDEAIADSKRHDIFAFPGLRISDTADQSRMIIKEPNPKVILAGSGMSNGGRVVHHEMDHLGDSNNTILFLGYQAVGTLGRKISEGNKEIEINGQKIKVKARIEKIDGYSSHKDSDHLVEFVNDTAKTVKKVFVVMGETNASLFLAQRLRDYDGVNAVHPEEEDVVVLD